MFSRRCDGAQPVESGWTCFFANVPIVTYVVMGICLLAFLVELMAGGLDPAPGVLYALGGFISADFADGIYWRMLSSGFLHGGALHLVMNMLCLYQLGRVFERLAGNAAMAFAFLVSTLFGAVACALAYPPNIVCVGASGGVFGLAGALITFLLVGGMGFATARSCLSFVGLNLLLSLTPGISMAAHVGGLLAGAAVGALLGWVWRTCLAAGSRGAWRYRFVFNPVLWGVVALALLVLFLSFAFSLVPAEP